MRILSWILENLGGYVLEHVLDRVFEDKAKGMEEAFDRAYNTWYVSHNGTVILRQDYEKLKPRFINSVCHKDFKYDSKDEEELFKEWYKQINKGIDAHDEFQSELAKNVISELSSFETKQVQVNQEMLSKLTELTESVLTINSQSERVDALEKGVNELKDMVATNSLKSPLHATKFTKVKGYVERYVVTEKEKNNFVRFILKQKPQTLYDMVCSSKDGENKFLLVDKGQSGKTTELKELGYKLSNDGRYFPLLYEPYDSASFSKKDLPVGDVYESKTVVLLIDAADEFKQDDRSRLFNIISDYAKEHLHTIIVISCRNNYEEVECLRKDNIFTQLAFEDLTTDQWKAMIRQRAGKKAEGLISLINDKGLEEYMNTPFEIAVIANYYLEKGELLTTRADIYRQFINSKLTGDEDKNLSDSKHLKYDTLPYLERMAVIMQSYGNDFILTYPQVLDCLDNKDDLAELIKRSNLIIPVGKDSYRFSENAYREYLAADYLSKQSFTTIISFIKYDNGDLMRQQWANVSLILLSILFNKDKGKYGLLFDWMVKYQPDFVLFLERNTVEKRVREAIFRNLLSLYRKQKRIIAPANHQTIKRIMQFAQSTETVEYLLLEVLKNKEKDQYYLENLYSFLEYADFSDLYLFKKQKLIDNFTNFVFHLIAKHKEDTDEKAFVMYFPLNNSYYHEDDRYVKRLIDTVGDTHNRYAVDAVISMICYTNLYDEFADYVIDHEADIHDYQDKRGVTVSVFRFAVNKAMEGVTEKDNVIKVLSHLCTRDYLLENHYRDSDTLDIVKALLETAEVNKTFDDDKESLQSLLKIYADLITSTLFSRPTDLYIVVRDFFKDNQFAEELYNDAIDDLRNNIKGYDFDKLRSCLYVINIFLTKERIDLLVDSLSSTSNDDYTLITNIAPEVLDKELQSYLRDKIDNKYGRRLPVRDWDAEKRKSINQLFDYDRFRLAVIEAVNKYPQVHKDLRSYTIPPEDRTDQYVSAFFYMTSKEPYDLEKIRNQIEDKGFYYRFLLYVVHQNRDDEEFKKQLNTQLKERLIKVAEDNITLDKSYTFIAEASLYLLINGKLNLKYEQIEKLMPISNYTLGEKNLFDYIAKTAKKEGKQKKFLQYLTQHLNDDNLDKNVYVIWASYLIRNGKKNLYLVIFDWMQKDDNHWRHAQILEAYWSTEAGRLFVQYNFNDLSEDDKISLLRIIENNKKDEELEWIASHLTDFASFKDFNRKTALQFLLYRGNLEALNYVVSHYEPKYLEMSYPYNYNQAEATDGIMFLFHKVVDDGGDIAPNCYNSLRQSIINISVNNKDKRKQILEEMGSIASSKDKGWLYDEIERIEEELLKQDDEPKSFKEVLSSVPVNISNADREELVPLDDYKVGNIVRLREDKFLLIKDNFLFPQNLFYIGNIDSSKNTISLVGMLGAKFKYNEIMPVRISSSEDRDIYIDLSSENETNKNQRISDFSNTNSYYLDEAKWIYDENGITWYNIIKNHYLSYVHQIQNTLNVIGSSLRIHYHIETHTVKRKQEIMKLGDLGTILTKSVYLNKLEKDPKLRNKGKVFINQRVQEYSEVASNFPNQNYSYVLICHDKFKMRSYYYSFILNSALGKMSMINGGSSNGTSDKTSMAVIKNVPIVSINDYVASCCLFQSFMELFISAYNKSSNDNKQKVQPFYDYLSRLRDAMVMELTIPVFFEKFSIKILDSWLSEINQLVPKFNKAINEQSVNEAINDLFTSLYSKDNELMKNMNKYRLYSSEFLELVNKKNIRL